MMEGVRRLANRGLTRDCVCRSVAIVTGKSYRRSTIPQPVTYRDSDLPNITEDDRAAAPVFRRKTARRYLAELKYEFVPMMGIGTGCELHLREGTPLNTNAATPVKTCVQPQYTQRGQDHGSTHNERYALRQSQLGAGTPQIRGINPTGSRKETHVHERRRRDYRGTTRSTAGHVARLHHYLRGRERGSYV